MKKKRKPREIDGIYYYPIENIKEKPCNRCGQVTKRMYAKNSINSSAIFCYECVDAKQKAFERWKSKNAFAFPKDEVLYVGKVEIHQCESINPIIRPRFANFYYKNKKHTIQVKICECCGKSFIAKDIYVQNEWILTDYRKTDDKSGKEIISFESKGKSLLPPKVHEKKIPASVSWNATHPFQGGDCMPK